MENNAEVKTLPNPVPLESDSESECKESATVNNLDQSPSNEDWLRYAGRLAFAVEKAEALLSLLKKCDDIVRLSLQCHFKYTCRNH